MTSISLDRKGRSVVVASALATLLALAGCASDIAPTASPTGTVDGALLPAAEGTTQYPLTLTTWAGESVLDERPERIAVIGFSPNLDALDALDVTPVYTITDNVWGWRTDDWAAGIEVVDAATRSDPTNFEGIAAADPDLIVAVNWQPLEDDFEKLSAIAPVLAEEEFGRIQLDWRSTQELVGEALDLSAASQDAITAAEEAIAAVAESHPQFQDKTITLAYDYGADWEFEYYTVTGGRAESIVLDLGFAPNPLAENFVQDAAISDENVGLVDADILVVFYSDEESRDAREAQPLFQAVPAVADGRYLSLVYDPDDDALLITGDGEHVGGANGAVWVMRNGASPVSLPWALDVIANEWLAGFDH